MRYFLGIIVGIMVGFLLTNKVFRLDLPNFLVYDADKKEWCLAKCITWGKCK